MDSPIKIPIFNEYNRYAGDVLVTTFFTVALWMASQTLINEGVKTYLPGLQTYQLALVEIVCASYGLYYFTKKKDANEVPSKLRDIPWHQKFLMPTRDFAKIHADEGCEKCKKWLEENPDGA